MDTSTKVTINGQEYTISRFKFGKQMEYAKTIGKLFSGVKYNLVDNKFADFDLGELVSVSPDISLEILSIGLGVSIETVREFDPDEAEAALAKVLEINPVNEVLKKSMTLLGSSLKA